MTRHFILRINWYIIYTDISLMRDTMVLDSGVKEDEQDKTGQIEVLKAIQAPVNYTLVPLTKKSLLRSALARIPWVSKFSLKFDDAADTAINIGERVTEVNDSFGNESIAHGFHYAVLAMAILDFVRIPLIYFAAYLFNEKIPIKMSTNLRWAYSAFLLGLTITALVSPVTAPVIAFVSAGTGLVFGIFLLARTLINQYKLGRERKLLHEEIIKAEEEMKTLQEEAKDLEQQLTASTGDELLALNIKDLEERYNSQKSLLSDLKNQELHIEQKIARVGMMRVLDKSIGIGLTSLSIIGLVVTLFVPPVGGWILAGAAIAGGVYLFARLMTPVFKFLGNWLINQFKPTEEPVQNESKEHLENDHQLEDSHKAVLENILESNNPVSSPISPDDQLLNSAVTNSEIPDDEFPESKVIAPTVSQDFVPEHGLMVHEVDSTAVVLASLMSKEAIKEYSEHQHEQSDESDNVSELDGDGLKPKRTLLFKPEPTPDANMDSEVVDTEDEGENEAVSEHP
ncbi:coiled-coil protein [Legionella moravica]|uniref:Coiled-coil protein n=2 Tax=Legionella moravica TaxID=39962 RepID=A0A378K318_9GAMM|nr:coiled-coil protein [Legionella moravica]STX63998.1 coiled-coil protein [Legionella moravica]